MSKKKPTLTMSVEDMEVEEKRLEEARSKEEEETRKEVSGKTGNNLVANTSPLLPAGATRTLSSRFKTVTTTSH